jgi:hypothetical protein
LGAFDADILISKHMLHLLGRPHLAFGQPCSASNEGSSFSEKECRAAATQVQKQKLPEAYKRGEAQQKSQNFADFLNF